MKHFVVIEDWDGDGAIRIPDGALQQMDVKVGDSLYLRGEYLDTTHCLVLSKKPHITDRVNKLAGKWDTFSKVAADVKARKD